MKLFFLIVILFYSFIVLEKENQSQAIVGANIYWQNTTIGTSSDTKGEFEIEQPENEHMLVVSFVGFEKEVVHISGNNNLTILLKKNLELNEVLVKERQKGQYISTLNPIQSTKVTATELQKAACCNLSESFETNASVDVSFTDAFTGAKQIQMLGLSGIYVQTISENMPMIRGMAAPYGLGYIPGPWMESIQISKGTSSVLNGYEAISGQINVKYKNDYLLLLFLNMSTQNFLNGSEQQLGSFETTSCAVNLDLCYWKKNGKTHTQSCGNL